MASPKQKLEAEQAEEATETSESREVYLRDGRKLVVSEQGADQVVEVRSESGMLELRIKLTEEGPVLQMEAVKMSLSASESVDIKSKKVSIESEDELEIEAAGDVRVRGKMIYLN